MLAALCAAGSWPAQAGEVHLTLPFAYRLVQEALVKQVFIGPNETVRVLEGKNACNVLTLSEARVEGGAAGRVRVLAKVTSRGGTPLTQGRCLPLFEWTGTLEALQQPYVIGDRLAIGFRVVDSDILGEDEARRAVPGVVWNWVKKHVHPRLDAFNLSVNPALIEVRGLLTEAMAGAPAEVLAIVDSLQLTGVVASVDTLNTEVAFTAPDIPPDWRPAPDEPVLNVEELEAWRGAWQAWDAFATWLVKYAANGVDAELRAALASTLLDARYDLLEALASDSGADPVRGLFLKTWTRLAPQLEAIQTTVPAAEALRYLSFISAADALRALDSAAPQLRLRVDRETLRRLARVLLPDAGDEVLAYSTDIDPALRVLLGFDPELAAGRVPPRSGLAWLIRPAHAAVAVDSALAQRLSGWVPQAGDLDAYLRAVAALLDQIAHAELARGKVPARFGEVYQVLIQATAWQETCWRQYEIRGGKVQTIQSPVGSVGIMQVNKHVWRGVYDLNALVSDVGFNARAGNEILVHYLVDYAIRKGEHRATGDPENLARASYAVYNGGPGHLRRYRDAKTKGSLRRIDAAFWDKYQAIQARGAAAVKQCYGQ